MIVVQVRASRRNLRRKPTVLRGGERCPNARHAAPQTWHLEQRGVAHAISSVL